MYIAQIEEISAHLAKTEADYNNEIHQLRQRLGDERSASPEQRNLAEDEKYIEELTDRLRKQLHSVPDDSHASSTIPMTPPVSCALRSVGNWQIPLLR